MYRIRMASASDIPALLDVQQQYWAFEQIDHFHYDRNRIQLQIFLTNPAYGFIFVAVDSDEQLHAYIIACWQFSFEYGGLVASIDECYVAPAARGQGVGAQLLQATEQHCRALGCVSIDLEVDVHNHPAHRFYRRHHFLPRDKYATFVKLLQPATPSR